jgi:formiminotetrahydrofolate cyclodeaminase
MTSHSVSQRTIGDYLETLGSELPTPGGGSVTGLIGALAAALGQMVASVTLKSAADSGLKSAVAALRARRDAFLAGAAYDEVAYSGYLAATKLPRGTAEEKSTRQTTVQNALLAAANAPLAVATNAAELLDDLLPVIAAGGLHVLSDGEVAIILAEAAVASGLINVRTNVPYLKDARLAGELTAAASALEISTAERASACRAALASRRTA